MRSFGTILEWEYAELTVIVFFWDRFWFRNGRNRRNSGLSGIDRIAGNPILLAIFPVFCRENSSVSSPQFLSRQLFCFQNSSLFFRELIFCIFCYSYTRIRINGIVPKECALNSSTCLASCVALLSGVRSALRRSEPQRSGEEGTPSFWSFYFQIFNKWHQGLSSIKRYVPRWLVQSRGRSTCWGQKGVPSPPPKGGRVIPSSLMLWL